MGHSPTYFNLLDALAQEGCPICRLSLAAVHRYLDSVNYDGVNDTEFRIRIRSTLGFCNLHSHQWLQQAHVLGTALIYEAVLADLTAALKDLATKQPSRRRGLAGRLASRRDGENHPAGLAPADACPACRVAAEETRVLIATLVKSFDHPAFRTAYLGSSGLCLPHLRKALRGAATDAVTQTLRDHAVATQEQLASHLREVIRKHDYRHRDELSADERQAAARAVAHVAGAPGIR
jgi:hypothetical protein